MNKTQHLFAMPPFSLIRIISFVCRCGFPFPIYSLINEHQVLGYISNTAPNCIKFDNSCIDLYEFWIL